MEEMHRARYVVSGMEFPGSLDTSVCSPAQKLPQAPLLGDFMEVLLHSHDISLTQYPAPLWRRDGGGTKISTLLNMTWFFW